MARFKGLPLEPFIEQVITSEDAGYSKPHSGIFNCAFRALGIVTKDRPHGRGLLTPTLQGIGFGIRTCWYNPTKSPTLPGLEPDYEIANLRDLSTFL